MITDSFPKAEVSVNGGTVEPSNNRRYLDGPPTKSRQHAWFEAKRLQLWPGGPIAAGAPVMVAHFVLGWATREEGDLLVRRKDGLFLYRDGDPCNLVRENLEVIEESPVGPESYRIEEISEP